MKRFWIVVAIVVVLGIVVFVWPEETADSPPTDASLVTLLTEENTDAYKLALVPDNIRFPQDFGPHPGYQTEWWYYTGTLETAEGRQFGYQFTIFRRALTPKPEQSLISGLQSPPSDWRTNQVYLAHFAISDIAAGEFYPAERFSRGAAGLAGAQAVPYRVWLEDWMVEEIAPEQVRIKAQTEDVALDITLEQTVPPVLHGDGGLSQKGPEPGNASYYYSIVRQQTSGHVSVQGERFNVTGLSWKDHEYSTSALSEGAIGWDWFSLHLENGAALMFFQIRREDGTLERFSSGSFIAADGTVTHLTRDDWNLQILDTWTSSESGAAYPAGWRIEIPKLDLVLSGKPLLADQELNVSTVYWEGAASFSGTLAGEPVSAEGYVEMTGYAETMEGRL